MPENNSILCPQGLRSRATHAARGAMAIASALFTFLFKDNTHRPAPPDAATTLTIAGGPADRPAAGWLLLVLPLRHRRALGSQSLAAFPSLNQLNKFKKWGLYCA
ncbi:hypothetical protein [Leisingera caerulea]|uniref:Uncharacterized protein n=1 Tax=Leisingera caerulea TaxID=506591 RepID=A0A9Q9HHD4_LEICA|nr:hypothetical protein [Leisingera caerulea]UWQ53897.1 hypothetical protein K3721_18270 [Leisingera caerulea]